MIYPKVVAARQPWAKTGERLRRNFKLTHHDTFFGLDLGAFQELNL